MPFIDKRPSLACFNLYPLSISLSTPFSPSLLLHHCQATMMRPCKSRWHPSRGPAFRLLSAARSVPIAIPVHDYLICTLHTFPVTWCLVNRWTVTHLQSGINHWCLLWSGRRLNPSPSGFFGAFSVHVSDRSMNSLVFVGLSFVILGLVNLQGGVVSAGK